MTTPDDLDRMFANDVFDADQRRLADMLPIEDHACSTGDCGHDFQWQCDETLAKDYPEEGK